jgi:hypothetical protein
VDVESKRPIVVVVDLLARGDGVGMTLSRKPSTRLSSIFRVDCSI